MGDITLTKILFVALIGVFMVSTLYGAYGSYLALNGGYIDAKYQAFVNNVSAQQNSLTSISQNASDRGLVTNIYNAGASVLSGTINVFVTGLKAIGMFFDMVPILNNILNSIQWVLGGYEYLGGLIGLCIVLLGLYIAMRYIKSASNKYDLP